MLKSIISEGKTTNEAIEKGLKQLNISRDMVDIKILENGEKRSFFNILVPRVVKVELTIKESEKSEEKVKRKNEAIKDENRNVDIKDLERAKISIEEFLDNFLSNVSNKEFKYSIEIINQNIQINITGEDSGFLIGYRGDVLNSLQTILSSIANKNNDSKIRIILDIENYRNKRKETLENLAIKVAKTVAKTGKSITLEPMGAYERKIIHSKLQDNKYVKTHSIGEEPNRKVVILKK
nr:Jag N-terminal domain-containing protein [Clostridia bacterium]